MHARDADDQRVGSATGLRVSPLQMLPIRHTILTIAMLAEICRAICRNIA